MGRIGKTAVLLAVTLLTTTFLVAAADKNVSVSKPTPDSQIQLKRPLETLRPMGNKKLESMYVGKQVFLVSDKEWKDVLGLVPVSMWMERAALRKYPVLIYHEEESGFDADSVIFFLEQYKPKALVIVGDTPEELDNLLIAAGYTFAEGAARSPELMPAPLTMQPAVSGGSSGTTDEGTETDEASPEDSERGPEDSERLELAKPLRNIREGLTTPPGRFYIEPKWITRISPADYIKYWEYADIVVICEDNYQLGLLASVYAAYINAPLLFDSRARGLDLTGKKIETVGETSFARVPTYTRGTLERKLVELYPTDKIMLVNYGDLSIVEPRSPGSRFSTLLTRDELNEFYSKTSLSAPFLAVAKNEIIITVSGTSTKYNEVKAVLEWKVASLGLKPNYLTIMASPIAIQMRRPMDDWPEEDYEEVDNHIYGDIDHDGFQDAAVGRIMGLTPSDISAYVARDIFIGDIKSSKNFASLWPPAFLSMKIEGKTVDRTMRNAGFIDNSFYMDEEGYAGLDAARDLENKMFVEYLDHGSPYGWGGIYTDALRNDLIKMDPSVVLSNACLTCAYSSGETERWYAPPTELWCSNILKHGAMAHIGAVDEGGLDANVVVYELLRGKDIGRALLQYKNVGQSLAIDNIRYREAFGLLILPGLVPYEGLYVLLGDPTLKIIPRSPFLEDATLSVTSTGNIKNVNIHINQPTEELHVDCGTPDEVPPDAPVDVCEENNYGEHYYYVSPSSELVVYSKKEIGKEPPRRYYMMEDILYWEMEGSYGITNINLKIKYADGTEETVPLEKFGDLYYASNRNTRVQISALKIPNGYRLVCFVKKNFSDLNFNKIIPSYDYEIDIETIEVTMAPRHFIPLPPSAATTEESP